MENKIQEKQKRYPEGHFLGIGFAIGIPIGMPIGLAMGNIAVGTAIGVAIGIPIGAALEKKYNPNPTRLTEEERRIRKRNLTIALGLGVIFFDCRNCHFFLIQINDFTTGCLASLIRGSNKEGEQY